MSRRYRPEPAEGEYTSLVTALWPDYGDTDPRQHDLDRAYAEIVSDRRLDLTAPGPKTWAPWLDHAVRPLVRIPCEPISHARDGAAPMLADPHAAVSDGSGRPPDPPASLRHRIGSSVPIGDAVTDPHAPCALHEMPNCALCHPPAHQYRRGNPRPDVPAGHYVEVRGGRGVYHHPDCYNVTGEWDGAATATLGERLVRSPQDIRENHLRPAECCQPPTLM